MAQDYLARLFQQRRRARIIRFDGQPVPRWTLDDLTDGLWQRFASPRVQDAREVLLGKLAVARPDADGAVRPTVAGVLMASADPRRWLLAVQWTASKIQPLGLVIRQTDAIDSRDHGMTLRMSSFVQRCTMRARVREKS
jgi:hypothetical protein